MKKLRLYIETSVWNFLIARDSPDKTDITREFFEAIKNVQHLLFISDAVIFEINKADTDIKESLKKIIRERNPLLLPESEEVLELAQRYVREGVVSNRHFYDALHVAYASVHNIDALVSWNQEHIVKMKTRLLVHGINKMLGYREIEICTPGEVI